MRAHIWITSFFVFGILVAGCNGKQAVQRTSRKESAAPRTTEHPSSPEPEATAKPPAPAPANSDFAWFDSLGFPDIEGCAFVRVAKGRFADGPAWMFYWKPGAHGSWGFPMAGSESSPTTVLSVDLSEVAAHRIPASVENHNIADPAIRNLEDAASAYLKHASSMLEGDDPFRGRHFAQVGHRTEVFILARVCDANGLDKLSDDLLALAEKLRGGQKWNEPAPPVGESVRKEIAHTMMWRAVRAFGAPAISRERLLERFEWIVASFPESRHAERAKRTRDLLRSMIAEDKAHAKKAKPLDEMTTEERVADLIFRLREQNGRQYSQPGSCDIFDDFGGVRAGEDTPAHKLVGIGYAAVPQLIEALDDQRFTRSVGFHRDFYFSHFVLRVGDCALAIIERIAGRSFYKRRSTSSEMVKNGEASPVKKEVAAWWKGFQKKGEKQSLLDAVSAGDDNSPAQATVLLKKYPEAVLTAIIAGTRNAKRPWVRQQMVRIAAGIKGDSPVPFLLEELGNGPTLASRVQAALGLHRRGRTEAVEAMIREWEGTAQPLARPGHSGRPKWQDEWDERNDFGSLISFLSGCGRPEAIKALGDGIRQRPVGLRMEIISSFGEGGNMSVFSTGRGGGINTTERGKETPEVKAAIENLLFSALDDTDERSGMSGSWGRKSFRDPRMCDVAGHVLWRRQPKKYDFDISASLNVREKQRAVLKNTWRARQGLPSLPLPKPPEIKRVADAIVDPLLRKAVSAATDRTRQRALDELVGLGLGALPRAQEYLNGLAEDHKARGALESAVGRLAFTVREVVVDPGSAQPDRSLKDRLDAVAGKPLSPDGIIGIMLQVAQALPRGATGIKLRADRPGNGTGVEVSVTLTQRLFDQGGSQKGWKTHSSVTVGEESLYNSSGSSSRTHRQKREAYEDIEKALVKALTARPDEDFALRLGLVEER